LADAEDNSYMRGLRIGQRTITGDRLSCLIVWLLLPLLVGPGGRVAAAQAVGPLANGGFDRDPVTAGWERNVYGAAPEMGRDTAVVHGGAGSVRIRASAPSDTALGQEVRLAPGKAYRLSAWVRTRGLDPRGAPVCGTVQVQLPGGAAVLASGANHWGDTDWTPVSAPFIAPADGRVRICLFFVGFGRGVGTAWFDDVEVTEMRLDTSTVTVTKEPVCAGEISPFQYGQFIEYLCDLVPAMWAEKLCDGGFEGLSPYKMAYLKETDFKERPWFPTGATNRAEFARDAESKISGAGSQRIAVTAGAPCRVGIAQSGIAVQRGAACRFACWLRSSGDTTVRATLRAGGRTLAEAEFKPSAEWRKFTATLTPSGTAADARLEITFAGPGTIWIDNASLMPLDAVGGWRRDVVDALRALKPGIIRFGGSALDDGNLGDFRWRDTIGDPDRRAPFRAWGGLQPAAAGLEEIVQLCRAVDAEPLICVRFTGSTPKDAADEVQYFNGPASTPMGAQRARNGHPEPYRIRYWQVGNERGGQEYEKGIRAFCEAMRAADPSIRLLSSYPSAGVLRAAGDLIDYVCPHQYDCADLPGTAAQLDATRRLIAAEGRGRPIHAGVTEWNTTAGDWGPRRAMLWTLENALACSRYQNLLHRNCDLVEIANRSNLTNSFCSGIIQTDNRRLYKTPTYYAQQLYSTVAGTVPLRLRTDLPPEFGPDISATLSKDGKRLTIFAVNIAPQPITRPLDLSAFALADAPARVWKLADRDHAGEPDATNSFDDPERIRPVRSTLAAHGPTPHVTFPAYSLTVVQWTLR